jgi:hypothetical protein
MHLEDESVRRTKTGFLPGVDRMEARLLLSTAAPPLSKHALTGVVREVRAIVNTLARTENTVQASAQLSGLSSQVSSGSVALALSWQADIGLYRPHSVKSINTTERRVLSDLYLFIQRAVDGGDGPASGSGSSTSTTPVQGTGGTSTPAPTTNPGQESRGTPTPSSTPSLDSVRIENTTGLTLLVTVQLEVPQVQQPSITETIPAQGDSIVCFDFGTDTGDFMTMDVSSASGGQSPPPWSNVNLSQPMGGYNGVVFTISLFGSYFSVNVP